MSDDTYVFLVPQRSILNSNQRLHHMEAHRRRSDLRFMGAEAWFKALHIDDKEPMMSAECTALVKFPTGHRRDANNWWPTAKSIIDGMVGGHKHLSFKRGILPDDDSSKLIGPDMRVEHDRSVPKGYVEVNLVFTGRPL